MSKQRSRPDSQVMECDVLVVGSEGAGVMAAVAAARAGASVLLVSKGKVGRSGATQTAGADFMADARSVVEVLGFPEGDLNDSPEEMMQDIVQEGEYLSNQKLVEVYVRNAPARIKQLMDWGMKVAEIEKAHGCRYPRGVIVPGPEIARTLRSAVAGLGLTRVEDVMATDLLVRDGRVVGALGLQQRTGAAIEFRARAVVLATGGWQTAYPWTTATDDLSGDGQAMAYRAGAELQDMEMVQFLPGIVINPPAWRRSIFIYAFPAGILLNSLGEAFLRRWDPMNVDTPMGHWPKETVSIAMKLEVLEGRGSPSGGVYYSLKHLPNNLVEDILSRRWVGEWKSDYVDFRAMIRYLQGGNALEVTGDAAHYSTGGIRIDETFATTLPGLYAAGECTGGMFGAERVASACTEMIVGGYAAGTSAAAFALREGRQAPDAEQVREGVSAIYAPLERESGPRPVPTRQALQKVAGDRVGVVRTGLSLEQAIAELADLCAVVPELATVGKSLRANREWLEALQLRNLVQVVDISARSALQRTESRGGHYRHDCPQTDNDRWVVNIVARQEGGQPELRLEPVTVTRLTPPGGTVPYIESSRR